MPRDNQNFDAFWRGFSSVLTLAPRKRRSRRIIYHGKAISQTTARQALAQDWKMVGAYLSAAFVEAKDDERREFTR